MFLLFEGNELLWGTITLGLSSSSHTFYKHRRDSSGNLVHHIVSHYVTLSLHCLEAATVNSFPDSVTSLLFTEVIVVRGREGHNEGNEHRKGEDEEEGGME